MGVPSSERKEVFTVLVITFGVRLCDQAKKLVKNAAKLVKLGVDPSLPPKLKHIIS
jgi:hypothetical protein